MSQSTSANTPEHSISFTRSEALVLHNFLARLAEDLMQQRPEDSLPTAEELVLWKIEGTLDKILAEPFSPDYAELLEEARSAVVRDHGFGG